MTRPGCEVCGATENTARTDQGWFCPYEEREECYARYRAGVEENLAARAAKEE